MTPLRESVEVIDMEETNGDIIEVASLDQVEAWLAEHDRVVRAPLQELIEEARETLTASSVPLGMTEAQFYRNLVHLAWGILSRDASSMPQLAPKEN